MTTPTRLRELLEAATPGDLSTAELSIAREWLECPMCGGAGEVEGSTFVNFDDKPLNVQFYSTGFSGIGPEFGAHEALWQAVLPMLPTLITALEELEALRAENARLMEAAISLAPWLDHWQRDKEFGLAPTDASLDAARQALAPIWQIIPHIHDGRGDDPDTCLRCGLDIRGSIHSSAARAALKGAPA